MRIFLVSEQLLLQELRSATFQPGEVQLEVSICTAEIHPPPPSKHPQQLFFFFPTQKQTNLFFYSSVGTSFCD